MIVRLFARRQVHCRHHCSIVVPIRSVLQQRSIRAQENVGSTTQHDSSNERNEQNELGVDSAATTSQSDHALSHEQMRQEMRKYAASLDYDTETADLIAETAEIACDDPKEKIEFQAEIDHEAFEHDGKTVDWIRDTENLHE